MRQSAAVFLHRDLLAMNAEHQTTLRVWMSGEAFESISIGSAPDEIGELALRHLDLSQQGVPHPPDLHKRAMSESFFAALGLELGKFPKGLKSCSVTREGGVLTFAPTRHKGGGSFVGLGEARFTLETQEPQAVGEAVLRCLDKCR